MRAQLPPGGLIRTAAPLLVALFCGGCSAGGTAAGQATQTAGVACDPQIRQAQAATLEYVARRVYHQVGTSMNLRNTVRHVRNSKALVDAVGRGDRAAALAALAKLTRGRIARIQVLRAGQRFVEVGSAPTLAPVRGDLRGPTGKPVGRFVLSIIDDSGYAHVTARLTRAGVVVRAGSRQLAGTVSPGPESIPDSGSVDYAGVRYEARSFTAKAFPAGSVRISVLAAPASAQLCSQPRVDAQALTFGQVAMRIFQAESSSGPVMAIRNRIATYRPLVKAVAANRPRAVRAAIVDLLSAGVHIVRIRVSRHGRLLSDVGGPYVIAPVHGTLEDGAHRVIGQFVMSIQDDLGYVRLVRRYTAIQIVLRAGARQVMGSLRPSVGRVPDRGVVHYRGVTYRVFSFFVEAFPSGPLRVSLLVPPRLP